jgi:hypothetical protein
MQCMGPERLVFRTAFQSLRLSRCSRRPRCSPALLTSTSTPPQAEATRSTAARTCVGSVTSAAMASASGPSSRASSASSTFLAKTATRSPRATATRAVAKPTPRDPPVTIQRLLMKFSIHVRGALRSAGDYRPAMPCVARGGKWAACDPSIACRPISISGYRSCASLARRTNAVRALRRRSTVRGTSRSCRRRRPASRSRRR